MGFTADIIIWDVESRKLIHRLALHKVFFYNYFEKDCINPTFFWYKHFLSYQLIFFSHHCCAYICVYKYIGESGSLEFLL